MGRPGLTSVCICSPSVSLPRRGNYHGDFYLIAKVILGGGPSGLLATGLFAVFATLWFVLPRVQALQRLILERK